MYIGDIQSKLKNRLKQHLYINTVIKQHSSNSSGMQRYYKIIIYPRCYVILMKLYTQYISCIIPLWFKTTICCSYAEADQPQSWCKGTQLVNDLPLTHFFAFRSTILPFSYAPNSRDRVWKHLFVSDFAAGLAHDTHRTAAKPHSTSEL